MTGISRYIKAVLALTLGFALFCGGFFLARVSTVQPYQVTASRRPPELPADISEPEQEDLRPDSLLPGERININTADVYELQRLPGIGEKRAGDIVAYREEHGPFQTVEELEKISGIGPKVVEGLQDYAAAGSE